MKPLKNFLFVALVLVVTAITYSNVSVTKESTESVSLFTLSSSMAIGEGPNAKYCRCRDYDCVAGNAISFRPICREGGGDCNASSANC